MTTGFADPVHGAQRAFRTLLDAMARPGRVLAFPPRAIDGVEPPAGMSRGVAITLITLLDAETTVALHGDMARESSAAYLRFHTGVAVLDADQRLDAAHAVVNETDASSALVDGLALGTDDIPQDGCTLIVQVSGGIDNAEPLPGASLLTLRGPGIESVQTLAVTGLSPSFWRRRIALEPLFPCGVDLLLVCGDKVAAVPRSTHVTFED